MKLFPLALMSSLTLLWGIAACQSDRIREEAAKASDFVQPGLVAWNAGGLEGAKQAASVSGRPVLLVEVFGQLDRVHC
ncbi:MAG: hypothetical protein H6830_02590 [Planctomycetes bacterium]|nr:hypothetical protein [Planctomycetota bacterium]MCB9910170.1 hypothetical protein [Planctomycetota bacterium]HPF14893.1 hypothetical protein [Planctomycetota bacterium]